MISRRRLAGILAGAGVSLALLTRGAAAQLPGAPPPDLTDLSDHPDLARALDMATHKRWRELCELVRALPPQSAYVLVRDIGDATEVDLDISGLAQQRMGRTIMGSCCLSWSWRYRGNGWSSAVSALAFREFFRRLGAARDHLVAALDADRDDGVAAALLIGAQMGLQDEPAMRNAFERFAAAARRPVGGYSTFAYAISDKWYGTQEEMLTFARAHAGDLLPASEGLVPEAHVETMFRMMDASNPAIQQVAGGYLSAPQVLQEIEAANTAYLAAPAPADSFAALFAHGQFSFAFYVAGQNDLARPHFVALQGRRAGPWKDQSTEFWSNASRSLGLQHD